MLHEHTAPRSEGQTFNVTVLGEPAGGGIRDLCRNQGAIAHGPPAYFHRGGNVALDKRRRGAERVRDIVKAFGGIISWKERRDIHVHR